MTAPAPGADKSIEETAAGLCAGFYTAGEPFCEEIFDEVTVGWSKAILSQLAEGSAGAGYRAVIASLLEAAPRMGRRAALHPCFGYAAELLSNETGDVRPLLCALACAFAETGYSGQWRIPLSVPLRFRIGRALLPPMGEFSPDRAALSGATAELLPVLYFGAQPAVCFSNDFPGSADLQMAPAEVRRQLRNSSLQSVLDGIELLRAGAPDYLAWISRVIAVLLVTESREGLLESGSFPQCPGMLRVAADPRPSAVAEMLVHEASHQYFYLLSRLGPLLQNNGGQFYSPLKETNRPLDKIFLGYHAFANVLLMHERLAANNMPADGYSGQPLDRTRREVQQMSGTLARHAEFSPLGRALYDSLARRTA